jgi:hypothetical protein
MPREEEMLPKDKYTIFDKKEKTYRKGIHSTSIPRESLLIPQKNVLSPFLSTSRASQVDSCQPACQPAWFLRPRSLHHSLYDSPIHTPFRLVNRHLYHTLTLAFVPPLRLGGSYRHTHNIGRISRSFWQRKHATGARKRMPLAYIVPLPSVRICHTNQLIPRTYNQCSRIKSILTMGQQGQTMVSKDKPS